MSMFLTIDDAPSVHMHEKVKFLQDNEIPAIFYARGEFIENNAQGLEKAIEARFIVGNHSYSHPYFSKISLEECILEIEKTERLIDKCYKKVGVLRENKIIRLPFGDRGAGAYGAKATKEEELEKVNGIQDFLSSEGFQKVDFPRQSANFIDSLWDLDTKDYKNKYIKDEKNFLDNLQHEYELIKDNENCVILLHDFDNNHHLFEAAMRFFLDNNSKFGIPDVL